jgi:hypothetical protein
LKVPNDASSVVNVRLAGDPQCSTDRSVFAVGLSYMTFRRSQPGVPVTLVILLAFLSAGASPRGDRKTEFAAVAAVVHHVAPRILGDPPQVAYLAYLGKTPPPELVKLVSDLGHMEPMPPTWRPGLDESSIELLDVWNVDPQKSGEMLISAQVVGPLGIAVEGCTYTVRLTNGVWQVDTTATACLAL